MKQRKITLLLTLMAASAFASRLRADVTLPNIISDNMVLQRDANVAVWGWADRGETVTVEFAGQKKSAKTDRDGKWLIHLDPMKASDEGRTLVVSQPGADSGDRIEVRNVLVGEVWLCSGQSNMTWNFNVRVKNKQRVIDSADKPLIRYAWVQLTGRLAPADDCPVSWQVTSPDTVKRYACVPYYFALRLHEELGVPIGVIVSGFGGAQVQAFTDLPTLQKDPDFPSYQGIMESFRKNDSPENHRWNGELYLDFKRKQEAYNALAKEEKAGTKPPARPDYIPIPHVRNTPTAMFYGMIQPLMPYHIKGAIWYQGENNVGDGWWYRNKLAAMIDCWRTHWGIGDFSFYSCQLPGSGKYDPEALVSNGWPEFREAQTAAMIMVPHAGIANLIDIGETNDVHAWNKQSVGNRLALWALAKDYGRDIAYSGPIYRAHKIDGNKVMITFDHVGEGLTSAQLTLQETAEPARGGPSREWKVDVKEPDSEELTGFAIFEANKDARNAPVPFHKTVPAKAKITSKDTVEVWSDEIENPVGVRYAWVGFPKANLYNGSGLPTLPFRTDKLKLQIQARKESSWKSRQ